MQFLCVRKSCRNGVLILKHLLVQVCLNMCKCTYLVFMFSNSEIRQRLNNFLLQALKIGGLLNRRNLQKLGYDYVELEVGCPNLKYEEGEV